MLLIKRLAKIRSSLAFHFLFFTHSAAKLHYEQRLRYMNEEEEKKMQNKRVSYRIFLVNFNLKQA